MKSQKLILSILVLSVLTLMGTLVLGQKTESISESDRALYKGINPGEVLLNTGESMFEAKQGTKKTSCAQCHNTGKAKSLKGSATSFPKVVGNEMLSLQLMVNQCLEKNVGAKKLVLKSQEMVAYVLYIKSLSNGMKVNVATDGEAKKWYDYGEKVFKERRGQRNLSCYVCHVTLVDRTLRMQKLVKIGGGASHWPGYRMTKGKTLLVERRFQQCMKNARMKPLKMGSKASVALELYVTSLGNGTEISVPGLVR